MFLAIHYPFTKLLAPGIIDVCGCLKPSRAHEEDESHCWQGSTWTKFIWFIFNVRPPAHGCCCLYAIILMFTNVAQINPKKINDGIAPLTSQQKWWWWQTNMGTIKVHSPIQLGLPFPIIGFYKLISSKWQVAFAKVDHVQMYTQPGLLGSENKLPKNPKIWVNSNISRT
jgi:hypothetical protein